MGQEIGSDKILTRDGDDPSRREAPMGFFGGAGGGQEDNGVQCLGGREWGGGGSERMLGAGGVSVRRWGEYASVHGKWHRKWHHQETRCVTF